MAKQDADEMESHERDSQQSLREQLAYEKTGDSLCRKTNSGD